MRRLFTVTVFTVVMLAILAVCFLMRDKNAEDDSFYITVSSIQNVGNPTD